MNVFSWFVRDLSAREKALSLYKKGMAKAKKHDHQGAIDDYTQTMAIASAPPDVKAMVLYNRALVQVATGEHGKGIEDLNAVLVMEGAPAGVKVMAKQKLARIESRSRKNHS